MSSAAAESLPNSPFAEPSSGAQQPRSWARAERWLERGSEWLNPILVKEARQALKSRQFVATFSLLLLFGWAWSFLGVALLSPGVYFAPGGRVMLTGYLLILLVPMIIVVPFSAFRSLAAEREDGTFELLSITSLTARQIVTGKLGSAMVQMIVYYSALAPCIAFTYLLRGIDILTIMLLLFYTFVLSVLLSSVGLLVATVSRSRHWQVLLSVTLVMALCGADFIAQLYRGGDHLGSGTDPIRRHQLLDRTARGNNVRRHVSDPDCPGRRGANQLCSATTAPRNSAWCCSFSSCCGSSG